MSLSFYLIVKHDGRVGPAGEEAVGPFPSKTLASNFWNEIGPRAAVIEARDHAPEDTMSPDEYLTYVERRI